MSRMVGRSRIAQAAAVLLGLVVVGPCALTVVLDAVGHYRMHHGTLPLSWVAPAEPAR